MDFKIMHSTGYMNLKAPAIFIRRNRKDIKLVLNLAKQYCKDYLRLDLIRNIKEELTANQNLNKPERARLEWCIKTMTTQKWN